MANATIENLKARCEALGYELIVSDKGEQLVIETHTSPHPFLEVVFIHRGPEDDDLEGWLDDHEKVSERVRTHDFRSERTSAGFNSPTVLETYERFLSLLVMAGMKDRLDAMEVRRTHGVEKAVEFLGECKLSGEHLETDDEPAPRANTPYDDVLLGIERCQALAKAIEHEVDEGHAPLWTILQRELAAVDDLVETTWGRS